MTSPREVKGLRQKRERWEKTLNWWPAKRIPHRTGITETRKTSWAKGRGGSGRDRLVGSLQQVKVEAQGCVPPCAGCWGHSGSSHGGCGGLGMAWCSTTQCGPATISSISPGRLLDMHVSPTEVLLFCLWFLSRSGPPSHNYQGEFTKALLCFNPTLPSVFINLTKQISMS